MPSLGADMDEAALVGWLVAVGDEVARGEVVAEVETDKGIIEVECWHDGVVEELLVTPGPERLPVGTPLARIRTRDGAKTPLERKRMSPRARAMAKEAGVDPARIEATRTDGMVTADDVASAPGASGIDSMRRAISRSMERSKREIPHYYLSTTIDLSNALEFLDSWNDEVSVARRVLPAAMFLRATAIALGQVPQLNGYWRKDGFEPKDQVNLGVAVSLRDGGLVAPAISDAANLRLEDMMERLKDVVARARSGKLRSSEIGDATITVTNLGDRGVETAFPIIIPPQVAIVAFGRIVDRPLVRAEKVVPGRVVNASLAGDHRVTDGHQGGLFLSVLDRALQEPEAL